MIVSKSWQLRAGAWCGVVIGWVLSGAASAADASSAKPGEYGIVMRDGVFIRAERDGDIVRRPFATETLLVLESDQGWLRVREGWVAGDHLISPQGAVEHFTPIIERAPTSLAYACRARAYLMLKRPDDGLADAKHAVELDANYPPAWYVLGSARSRTRNVDSAVAAFQEAVRLAPNLGGAHRALGYALGEKKQYRAALSAFDAAVANGAGDAGTFCARGACRLQFRKAQQAVDDFTRAIELGSPPEPYYYANRAAAYVMLKKYNSALSDANRAVDLAGSPVHELTIRASVRALKGDRDGALRDFARSIELEPNQAEAFSSRAQVNVYADRMDDALADAERALRHDPNDAVAFFARGVVYHRRHDNARAMDDLNKSVSLAPHFPASRAWRGVALLRARDYAQAEKDLTTAIELDALYASPHHYLGWLYAMCLDPAFRDGKRALAHAKRAIELAPSSDGNSYEILAAAYAELGDFAEALGCLDKAAEREKDDPAALERIAVQREEYEHERRWPLELPEPTHL